MKGFIAASIAGAVLASSSAFAADMGIAPNAPPPVNRSGCYVAGGVGYGLWKQNSTTEATAGLTPLSNTISFGGEGWLGRVGGGCDYQTPLFGGRLVIGGFADYDFMNVNGQSQDPLTGYIGTENESGSWAVGGRVGYLVIPGLLGFFDAGYTGARFDQINLGTLAPPPAAVGLSIPAQTYSGWFLGSGYEYALGSVVPIAGLFWRTEYRFASYQTANVPIVVTATGAPFGLTDRVQKDVQTITSGLVWRFNWWGGPTMQ